MVDFNLIYFYFLTNTQHIHNLKDGVLFITNDIFIKFCKLSYNFFVFMLDLDILT